MMGRKTKGQKGYDLGSMWSFAVYFDKTKPKADYKKGTKRFIKNARPKKQNKATRKAFVKGFVQGFKRGWRDK